MTAPADAGSGTTTARRRLVTRGAVRRGVVGATLLATGVLVVVLVAGGGAPQRSPVGLPDAGALTGWALPLSRLVADLAALATVGLLLAAAVLLPSPAAQLRWVPFLAVRTASRTALAWAAAALCQALLALSDLLGAPLSQSLDPALVASFVRDIPQGRALAVQAVLALTLAVLSRLVVTNRGAALLTLVAVIALVPPALTGHSAAAGSHGLAVASLSVHVVAASLWVGGLLALAWAAALGDGMRHAVPRYSVLAAWCFVAVAVSGLVNAWVRLGGPTSLLSTSYGVLVLVKVVLLVALGALGWQHRRRTVARLAASDADTSARDDMLVFVRVAAAELVVMAVTVAVAVGLSRTPTPVGEPTDTSAAAKLLGFSMPPAPTLDRMLLGWNAEGFALSFLVLAALLYAIGLRTLRRRGAAWPLGRTVAWYSGLVVVAWATVGGLGLYSHVLFSAHMISHMLLSMVAPIGLVLGAPITLALRTLPGGRTRDEAGPRQLLLAALHSPLVSVLTHPLVALTLWVGSLYALYLTPLFPALMGTHLGHVAMEAHFLAVGGLFFWTLVGVDPAPRRWHPLARIGLLLAAVPFHAFFSIALMSSDRLLAAGYYRALDRPYSTDLLADQRLGGGIGWALSELPILLVVAAIFVQWFRADQREATRLDRSADRAARRAATEPSGRPKGRDEGRDEAGAGSHEEPVDELAAYNARLARLHERDRAQQPPRPVRRVSGPGPRG